MIAQALWLCRLLKSRSMRLFPLLLCLSLSALAQDEPPAGAGAAAAAALQRADQRLNFRRAPRPQHRPRVRLRPRLADRDVPRQYQPLPDRRGLRRRLADAQQRHHLDPGLRQLRLVLHRLRSRSTRRIPRSSGSAPARTTTSAASPTATASTRATTAAAPGATSASRRTEHIARIVIDPRDSNVVYVAAPGPLWKGGGERGLYKTTDGGKTWTQSLIKVGEYTGCSRRRHGPAQSRHPARRHPSAAAPLLRHDPRRAGERHSGAPSTPARPGRRSAAASRQGELGRIGLNYAPSQPEHHLRAGGRSARAAADSTAPPTTASPGRSANSSDSQGQYYAQGSGGPGQLRTASTS